MCHTIFFHVCVNIYKPKEIWSEEEGGKGRERRGRGRMRDVGEEKVLKRIALGHHHKLTGNSV